MLKDWRVNKKKYENSFLIIYYFLECKENEYKKLIFALSLLINFSNGYEQNIFDDG